MRFQLIYTNFFHFGCNFAWSCDHVDTYWCNFLIFAEPLTTEFSEQKLQESSFRSDLKRSMDDDGNVNPPKFPKDDLNFVN